MHLQFSFFLHGFGKKTSPSSQSAIQWFAALLPEEGGSGALLGYSCSYCTYENTTTTTKTQKNAEAFSSGFREPGSDSTEQRFTAENGVFLFVFFLHGSSVYKNLQPQKHSCDTENEIITDGRFHNSLSASGCFFFFFLCIA